MILLHEITIETVHWKSPSRFLDTNWLKGLRHWFFEVHAGVRRPGHNDSQVIRASKWWNPYMYATVLGFQFGFGLLFMTETAQAWRARYLAAEKAKEVKP